MHCVTSEAEGGRFDFEAPSAKTQVFGHLRHERKTLAHLFLGCFRSLKNSWFQAFEENFNKTIPQKQGRLPFGKLPQLNSM